MGVLAADGVLFDDNEQAAITKKSMMPQTARWLRR